MFEILEKKQLNVNTVWMIVKAERVAKSCLPGQFVIVRSHEDAERIPLTICDYDREKGTVTIVFQVVGAGTQIMQDHNDGGSLVFQFLKAFTDKRRILCIKSTERLIRNQQLRFVGKTDRNGRFLQQSAVDLNRISPAYFLRIRHIQCCQHLRCHAS